MDNINRFGRFYWREMFTWALHLGEQGRKPFEFWIYNLVKRFPCEKCRSHFEHHLKLNPISKNPDVSKWVWNFHNNVNRRLDKPIITYEDAVILNKLEEEKEEVDHHMYWTEMFMYALSVETKEEREMYREWIYNLAGRYKSKIFKLYLNIRPIERAIEPVIWVFNFHNTMNKLLGKPEMRYREVLQQIVDQIKQCESCKIR